LLRYCDFSVFHCDRDLVFFWKFKFITAFGVTRVNARHVRNFVAIGQTVAALQHFAAVTFPDLVTLTFDLGHWSYMAGRVVNPCTKFEDPTLNRS